MAVSPKVGLVSASLQKKLWQITTPLPHFVNRLQNKTNREKNMLTYLLLIVVDHCTGYKNCVIKAS